MYTIYCHVFPNGKRYIGITKTALEKRWQEGEGYKTCPLVYRAIQKYGWDNVQHETLGTADTKEEAENNERHYIKAYDTCNPEKGYNILPGGDVANNIPDESMRYKLGNGQRGKSRTAEEKQKISIGVKNKFQSRPESNGHYGMKHSEETKLAMSKIHKYYWENHPDKKEEARERMKKQWSDPDIRLRRTEANRIARKTAKKREWVPSDEYRRKMSELNKGKWLGAKSPCSKPILQFSKEGVFIKRWDNAMCIERAGIANHSSVAACCSGRKHVLTVAGFIWRYE